MASKTRQIDQLHKLVKYIILPVRCILFSSIFGREKLSKRNSTNDDNQVLYPSERIKKISIRDVKSNRILIGRCVESIFCI